MRGSCVRLTSELEYVKRPRPYSEDLRWRMVFQRLFYERSYAEIASWLFVRAETVQRTVSNFLNTGDVKPYNMGRPSGSVTLIPHEEYIIMDCVLEMPQIQLHEIANHVLNAAGSAFGPETVEVGRLQWKFDV